MPSLINLGPRRRCQRLIRFDGLWRPRRRVGEDRLFPPGSRPRPASPGDGIYL